MDEQPSAEFRKHRQRKAIQAMYHDAALVEAVNERAWEDNILPFVTDGTYSQDVEYDG